MNSTPKINSDKFVWTDPSQLREVKVSEDPRVPDRHCASPSAPARVSESAKPAAAGNVKSKK
jgi:hypothetical protein